MLEDGGLESGIPIIAIQWLFIHRQRLRNGGGRRRSINIAQEP